MPIDSFDVVKANIIFIGVSCLMTPDEVRKFSDAVGTEVVQTGAGMVLSIPQGPIEPGLKLELHRERISLELMPMRTAIERGYPDREDLARLAEVTSCAFDCTETTEGLPTAFGYNLEMIYRQTSGLPSLKYLGARLYGDQGLGDSDWRLVGGAGRMVFDSSHGRWTIQLEPRFNDDQTDRVFLNLNLHLAEQRLPSQEEVHRSLLDAWGQAHSLIAQIDQRS